MTNAYSYRLFQTIIYNDEGYRGKEAILTLAQQLVNDDEEEKHYIGQFLSDWLNDNDFIELQTSGSTGTPKIIKVKKVAMVASAKRTIEFLKLQPFDSALLCLSAKYIAGKMMLVRAMVGQLNLVTSTVSSNPMESISRDIDFAAMVPMQVATILEENKNAFKSIRHLIIGGGRVNAQISKALRTLKVNAWETYGMTETVSHIALRNIKDERTGFRVLPGISVLSDKRGCLLVEASDINEQPLVTNDIVKFNSSNEFTIKGRYDNIINTGGVKVIAEDIETKLAPSITVPFAISWKKDDLLGQKVVLVCQSKEPVILESIGFLTKFEWPREVICIDKIPMTETGKIQRKKLQQLIDK
ncbi:AMP-binding protein [Carboxylicivirga sp. A043]|uniref:AMP-binding protein n=1 Tax=Carboxylicivirga litoralis TaxID=2816963 RepID=UPI0021CAFE57|nr:AMP-binding protein [Carboxylicivirga sp. A043]MCU4156941.1 AMP-binding protein [Carboxylicivirga sp. A043]